MASTINATTTAGVVVTPDNTGVLSLQTVGNTAQSIDASGRVTTPLQPRFFGYRDAGNVTATTTVLHNQVITNVGSCYNSSTGIFTCPVAGYYEVSAGGHGENATVIQLSIQKNGTTVVEEYQNGAAYGTVAPTGIILCAANDQIKSVVTVGTLWGGNISGLRMSIKLLG